MNREDYFNNALKIFDKRDNYVWLSDPEMNVLPIETVKVLDYYEARVSEIEGNEMYLAFVKYQYYGSLSEEDNVLLSDYGVIFYLKGVNNARNITKLIQIDSKEYNVLLMNSDREFKEYLLPDVIRKITEKDKNVEDFFNNL